MKSLHIVLLVFLSVLISCNQKSKDDVIYMQTLRFTTESCPKAMDEYTVLDSMVYNKENREMCYHYSVSGVLDIDTIYKSGLLTAFHSDLLANIQNNVNLIELKKHRVTFKYSYRSSTTAKQYMHFTFTEEDYAFN